MLSIKLCLHRPFRAAPCCLPLSQGPQTSVPVLGIMSRTSWTLKIGTQYFWLPVLSKTPNLRKIFSSPHLPSTSWTLRHPSLLSFTLLLALYWALTRCLAPWCDVKQPTPLIWAARCSRSSFWKVSLSLDFWHRPAEEAWQCKRARQKACVTDWQHIPWLRGLHWKLIIHSLSRNEAMKQSGH